MGMSSHVYGVRDLNGQFSKMLEVKLSCEVAGTDYPPQLRDYFGVDAGNSEECLRQGMELVDIDDAISRPNREMVDVFEVDVSKIPDEVKAIRFENSY